jgi:hypothetical protein
VHVRASSNSYIRTRTRDNKALREAILIIIEIEINAKIFTSIREALGYYGIPRRSLLITSTSLGQTEGLLEAENKAKFLHNLMKKRLVRKERLR